MWITRLPCSWLLLPLPEVFVLHHSLIIHYLSHTTDCKIILFTNHHHYTKNLVLQSATYNTYSYILTISCTKRVARVIRVVVVFII